MNQAQLQNQWNQLVENYADLPSISNATFKELIENYASPKRAYHNLQHIALLLQSAEEYKEKLHNYDAVRFAIWFHDVVYNPLGKDNEALSAEFAEKHLARLLISEEKIQKVKKLILATAHHMQKEKDEDTDTAFFLDFDLQILGSNVENYKTYSKQIRQEYSTVPDLLYKPGRKKVLQRFLDEDRLFRSEEFYKQYEKQARINLQLEVESLS